MQEFIPWDQDLRGSEKKKKQDWAEGLTQLTPMESSGAEVPLTVLS